MIIRYLFVIGIEYIFQTSEKCTLSKFNHIQSCKLRNPNPPPPKPTSLPQPFISRIFLQPSLPPSIPLVHSIISLSVIHFTIIHSFSCICHHENRIRWLHLLLAFAKSMLDLSSRFQIQILAVSQTRLLFLVQSVTLIYTIFQIQSRPKTRDANMEHRYDYD